MEFNSYVWKLYCDSPDGRGALERDIAGYLEKLYVQPTEEFSCQMYSFEVDASGDPLEKGDHRFREVNLREWIAGYATTEKIASLDEAERLFEEIADDGVVRTFEENGNHFAQFFGGGEDDAVGYSNIFRWISGVSLGLYDAHPEFFVPYLFASRFDELTKICHAFDIQLPQVPGKLQKRERALYYLAINRVFQDFRMRHVLSPQEFNAFLYDFAPKTLSEQSGDDLPPPSRIWFVIGGVGANGDFQYLDAADNSSVTHWQGNLETRRGDIVLMWCASPRSSLHSVWRALSEGFNDPFFYFFSTIRVGRPVKVKPVCFAEFSKHPMLGKKPAVRAHFQGASGTAFSVEEYGAVCELLVSQGFDISCLPQPPAVADFSHPMLHNERDVEQALVEPFLKSIGFTEKDWIRQLPLRMGRGQRNYPDYVLGVDTSPGEEAAVALIECKFDIETKKDLKDAFVQAKSYALRLQSEILSLAARRGVWMFQRRDDGFSIDHFIFKTWKELSHPDILHEVSLIVGKRTIEVSAMQRGRAVKKRRSPG